MIELAHMIELTEQPIDPARLLALVNDPECGAEVLFVGTTRQWTERSVDRATTTQRVETSHLIYEAFREMALAQLERLAQEARQRWPVRKLAIVHRLGPVAVSEASVAIAVSCPHRSEAFEAGRWLIDEVKHQVPIWKQEHYVQHGAEWIHPTSGNCRCTSHAPAANSQAASSQPDVLPQQAEQAPQR